MLTTLLPPLPTSLFLVLVLLPTSTNATWLVSLYTSPHCAGISHNVTNPLGNSTHADAPILTTDAAYVSARVYTDSYCHVSLSDANALLLTLQATRPEGSDCVNLGCGVRFEEVGVECYR